MAGGAGPAANWDPQPQEGGPPGAGRGQRGPARFSGPARGHNAMLGQGMVPASAGELSPGAGAGASGPGPESARPDPGAANPGPAPADPGQGAANPVPGPAHP